MICYDMMRNGARCAQVVTLESGKCIVAWPTSVIVYDSEEQARAVHIDHMGGRGEHTELWFLWASHADIKRGMDDCAQDYFEACPFASVGGLEARDNMQAPNYDEGKPLTDPAAYLLGYRTQARNIFGKDWQTCTFSWQHAMTIHADGSVTGPERS